jgi:predicted deacylase
MTASPYSIRPRPPFDFGESRIWTDLDLNAEGHQQGWLRLNVSNSMSTGFVPIPISVFKNGEGPRVLLLGGVHGDEYEGQVMAMKLMRTLKVDNIRGQIIILNAANAPAAYAGTRTSPLDDGNLNRAYPGDARGTPTQEIAYLLNEVLLPSVDYLLDFHSGGVGNYVLPSAHVYWHPDEAVMNRLLHMLRAFAMPVSVVLKGLIDHDKKAIGAADRHGVLRFASELGGAGAITVDALRRAEEGLARLLFDIGLLREPITDQPAGPIELYRRLPNGDYGYAFTTGVWEPYVDVGAKVEVGQAMGAIHFQHEPWREPVMLTSQHGGTVYALRRPAKTEMGQILYMIAVPFEG